MAAETVASIPVKGFWVAAERRREHVLGMLVLTRGRASDANQARMPGASSAVEAGSDLD